MGKAKKGIIIALITIFVVTIPFALIYFFTVDWSIDTKINKNYEGIISQRNNPTFSQSINIKIDGVIKYNPLRFRKFEGKLTIDGYTITEQNITIPFEKNYMSIMKYDFPDFNTGVRFVTFGIICFTKNFDTFYIVTDKPPINITSNYDETKNFFICAPAKTRDEAIKTMNIIDDKNSWDSTADWK